MEIIDFKYNSQTQRTSEGYCTQTDFLTSFFSPCMGCLMPGCCGGMPCCGGIMLPTAATGGAAAWA